jgi:fatty acyl-CoA reductase
MKNLAIRLAIFDLDGTILMGSKTVMPALAAQLWKAGFRRTSGAPRFALAALAGLVRKLRLISSEQYTEYGTRLILGWMQNLRPQELAPIFRQTTELLLKGSRPAAVAEIRARQAEGYRTVILSATIQPFLEELARSLDCEAVGTTVALDDDGRITGALAGPYCSGAAKLSALRAWVDQLPDPVNWTASAAYGDTLPDLPFLEAVGVPVVVAPAEPLRQLAQARGWRMIDG